MNDWYYNSLENTYLKCTVGIIKWWRSRFRKKKSNHPLVVLQIDKLIRQGQFLEPADLSQELLLNIIKSDAFLKGRTGSCKEFENVCKPLISKTIQRFQLLLCQAAVLQFISIILLPFGFAKSLILQILMEQVDKTVLDYRSKFSLLIHHKDLHAQLSFNATAP